MSTGVRVRLLRSVAAYVLLLFLTNCATTAVVLWSLRFYSLGYYSRPLCTYGYKVPTTPRLAPPAHSSNSTDMKPALGDTSQATIFFITPTYTRPTQKVDLTSLCHTLMHVPRLHWIVVEDSDHSTELVSNLLQRCPVASTQLRIRRSLLFSLKYSKAWKGLEQRNLGLNWVRGQCSPAGAATPSERVLTDEECGSGVVYFGDDDNRYDLRVFEQIRATTKVSVWPVAFVAKLKYEGPMCVQGKVTAWHTAFARHRAYPVDMAAFAVNLQLLLDNPTAQFPRDKYDYVETDFLEQLPVSEKDLKCCDDHHEALVWHVKTLPPDFGDEIKAPSDPNFET